MKIVSNTEYESALNNIDNIKIINKLAKKYKKYIPQDELESCMNNALWNALKKYDSSKGRKFTSYLYLHIEWECNTWIMHDKERNTHKTVPISESVVYTSDGYDKFNDMISVLPKKLARIMTQRFVYNMTFKEIGKKNKCSYESARQKFLEGIGILSNDRTLCSN